MKKVSYLLLSLVGISLLSCQKALDEGQKPADNDNTTFSVSMAETKTSLDGTYVKWKAGDQIRVYGYSSDGETSSNDSKVYTLKEGAGTRSAVFENTEDPIGKFDQYFAVYPADTKYNLETSSLPDKLEIKSAFNLTGQTAVENGFDDNLALMLGQANTNNQIVFNYGVAFIKITIPLDNVTGVSISGSGSWTCKRPIYNADGTYNGAQSGTKEVSATGTFVKGSSYYLLAPARGTNFGTLTVKYTVSGSEESFTANVSKSIVNGQIFDLGTPWVERTPELLILKSSINNVPAAGGTDLTITDAYSLNYCEDTDVTVSCASPVTAASISGGTITYSIEANTEEDAQTGYIYLKLNDNDPGSISINQLGVNETVTNVEYTWNFTDINSDGKLGVELKTNMAAGSYTYTNNGNTLTYTTTATNDQFQSASNKVYLRPNGNGSLTNRVLSFSADCAGTLTVNASSNNETEMTLHVYCGDSEITATSGGSSSSTTASDHEYAIPSEGTVKIYADNKPRYFEIKFSNQ